MPVLKARADVPRGTALLADVPGEYVALSSLRGHLPVIPWTIFAARADPTVPADTVLAGWPQLSTPLPVLVHAVAPPVLTSIVLTAPGHLFEELRANQGSIRARLPRLVRQGDFLESLNCRVRACEPVDQGLVDSATISISVALEPAADGAAAAEPSLSLASLNSDLSTLDLEISQFFNKSNATVQLGVQILEGPVPAGSIVPPPDVHEDLENACYLRVDQIAQLGVFSGDFVRLVPTDSTKSRIVRLFAFPEPHTLTADVYMPPLLAYNLGGPSEVQVVAAPQGEPYTLLVAKDVTISRIASATSTDRQLQQAFLGGLRSYFESSYRVVKSNDVIAVPIDTMLAQTLYNPTAKSEDELSLTGRPDAVVWFKISALSGGDDAQCIINPAHTRMVQSGLIQERAVPTTLEWPRYYGLEQLPPLTSHGQDHFLHAWKVRRLLESSLTPRGASLNTTMLLTSSKRGAGKATVLRSVAANLGVHDALIDCFGLVGNSDVKTVATLKARLERASHIAPCLIILKQLDAIAKKSETDGRDPTIVANINEVLDEFISKPGLIVAATANDPDKLSDSLRNRFKFEIDVTVPTEKERQFIFQHLTSRPLPPAQLIADAEAGDLLQGYALRGNISLPALALQSAGLMPPDLVSIVSVAKQHAHKRTNNDRDLILAQGGIVKISPADIEKAISDARSKYSDSIGAPRIPNVGWKDVGGLESVKGEIMDTIDMPLRYPQLFASGVKKRSGILFYGPPGTGKTLLAKAIATSFRLNFFSVKGPELLNMYIGESEANVRRVFQKARDAKPCVVFFDELDSVAPKRGNQGDSGGVMDRIVSQLLAELDGMSESADGVFVIGATNRPDLLDEALLRPGRFDNMLYLGVSDTHDKQLTILQALTRKFGLGPDVDLAAVAERCPFTYTGADFYAMSSDAMLNAMTRTAGEVDAKIAAFNKVRAQEGKPPVTIRSWFEHISTEEDTRVRVSAADFAKAQAELVPSVSAEELQHYLRVRNTFEGKAAAPTQPDLNGSMNGSTKAHHAIEAGN